MAVKTFTTGEVLTASDTNTYLANAGLVYITSTTASASSSISVSNCFSSTYDDYRIIFDWTQNTSNGYCNFKLRNSGGDISANYGWNVGGSYASSGVFQWNNYNGSANETQAQIETIGATAGNRAYLMLDVFNPNVASVETMVGMTLYSGATTATLTRVAVSGAGRYTVAAATTGFSLIASAGTMTGTVRVFGYRQA